LCPITFLDNQRNFLDMRLHPSSRSARGFTLVELLVVIAIIGLLVAILLPALSSARNSAQAAASGSNLSAFGRGFMIHSTDDKRSRLCTGAFDHLRDGDVRKVGWVADILKIKVGNPGKSLDPANPSTINEKVLDYIGATNLGSGNAVRWGGGTGKISNVFFGGTNGPTDFKTAPTQEQRNKLWEDGYNSNYATTWHFVRGDCSMVPGATPTDPPTLHPGMDPVTSDPSKCPLDGDGPLTEKKLIGGGVSRDRIALMGASRNGDGADALVTDAMFTIANTFFGPGQEIITTGSIAVESFCDGMTCPFDLTAQGMGGGTGPNDRVHEMNDIVPIHNARKNLVTSGGASATLLTGGYAQVLFADGHVAKVEDVGGYDDNPDGWLGAYKANPTALTSGVFAINKSGYDEVRELIWLHQIGNSGGGVGGGSIE
jgi:prepilin-type N-terminal cleavage/methylation domain-containing protein/prepilin-type processing-associated H-X9-DG protein